MKKYAIKVPIAGYAYFEVEAYDEEDAIDKVFEQGLSDDNISELDMYEKIAEGNVVYPDVVEIEIKEI